MPPGVSICNRDGLARLEACAHPLGQGLRLRLPRGRCARPKLVDVA